MAPPYKSQQVIVGCQKYNRFGAFGATQMKCVERGEAQGFDFASAIGIGTRWNDCLTCEREEFLNVMTTKRVGISTNFKVDYGTARPNRSRTRSTASASAERGVGFGRLLDD